MSRRARPNAPPTEAAKAAKARLKKQPKKEVIRLPRHLAEAAIAATRTDQASPSPPVSRYDFGEAAFGRIRQLRDKLEHFSAGHGAPEQASNATSVLVNRRMAIGAERSGEIVSDSDGYVIGCDFGTSSTKTVFRDPYKRGTAFVLPVPSDWASNGQPHLWPTALFFDPSTRRFSLLPSPGAKLLAGFKSALIEDGGHRMCGAGVTMAQAAIAFLALHLAYAIGTLYEHADDARITGLHFAVPVAALSAGNTTSTFERVMRAAAALVSSAPDLTLDEVKNANPADSNLARLVVCFTELSAAIAGYCEQPRRFAGAHMIIDCGSATLDIVSFTLGADHRPAGIYAASVERLGADACMVYERAGGSRDDCRNASRYQEQIVYRDTLPRAVLGFAQAEDRRYPYQTVLIGGGMLGEIHGKLFREMESAFQRPFYQPELGADLTCDPGTVPARLILADGLARDPIRLRDVVMPLDHRPERDARHLPEMISKDQV